MLRYFQMHNSWLPTGMRSSTNSPELMRSERKNFLKIFKGILQSMFQIGKPLTFTKLSTGFRKRTYKITKWTMKESGFKHFI